MMKVKTIGGESPHHCYFWMATLSNGNVIPEFDFENEKHNKVKDLPLEFVTQFSWHPVTLTMIEKVKRAFNEDLDIPVSERSHTVHIFIREGERLQPHPVWRNTISFLGHGRTTVLYALFKTDKKGNVVGHWLTENGDEIAE